MIATFLGPLSLDEVNDLGQFGWIMQASKGNQSRVAFTQAPFQDQIVIAHVPISSSVPIVKVHHLLK